ncbi:hypothetical protein BN903_96 [Halorubrum sp. AJ67]|nr:hypothetical protein BN903_96 [Halorubrum sp. AJ67]
MSCTVVSVADVLMTRGVTRLYPLRRDDDPKTHFRGAAILAR